MLQKKPSPSLVQARKELAALYARKRALDTLIDSLERYGRFRAAPVVEMRRSKTA